MLPRRRILNVAAPQIIKLFTSLFQRNSVFVGSVFVGESYRVSSCYVRRADG